jgi:hypothetical protein
MFLFGEYNKIVREISNLDFQEKIKDDNRQDVIGTVIDAGENICEEMQRLFNNSNDQVFCIFLAYEIKIIQENIKHLRSPEVSASDKNSAIVKIVARSQAAQLAITGFGINQT